MEEILELLARIGPARLVLADYPRHAMELASRKCVRSLAAADNVLIAAHAALVERESNRVLDPAATILH